jgi:AcrR family transcriptional regulator
MTKTPDEPAPLIWTLPPAPAKQRSLGRDEIVRAAIAVADEGGAAALTMSGVAKRLGAYTSMSLYRYVHSKDGLIDLMLDAVASEVDVPAEPGPDWRADLRAYALSSWRTVQRHLWYAQLVHSRPPAGPHMLRATEFILTVLTRRGLPVCTAMTYVALLDRHVMGAALQEAQERQMRLRYQIDTPEKFLAALKPFHALAKAGGDHLNIVRWLEEPSGPSLDEQVELGLDFLLDGIAGQLP